MSVSRASDLTCLRARFRHLLHTGAVGSIPGTWSDVVVPSAPHLAHWPMSPPHFRVWRGGGGGGGGWVGGGFLPSPPAGGGRGGGPPPRGGAVWPASLFAPDGSPAA